MELQFEKTDLRCMRQVAHQVVFGEQTQELRLPETMEDIGSVLAVWGQVLLRGKEWRTGGMGISGGVMTWVLYSAEGSGKPQCVEAWIPFQLKWDFPDTGRDGRMLAYGLLQSMDARTTSARKLMLRANVGVLGQAFVSDSIGICQTGELPPDVQVLKKTYPVRLPMEAGEKPFALEEELQLPPSAPKMEKLLRFDLNPEVQDQKVMADKVVFRGVGNLHILYMGEDGKLYNWDFEIPFSQYAELENTYEPDASAYLVPAVTALEMQQLPDGKLELKAGITGQYVISQRALTELAQDAYSVTRTAEPKIEEAELPQILQMESHSLSAQGEMQCDAEAVADIACYPTQLSSPDGTLSVWSEVLYYDPNGVLRGATCRWEDSLSLPADERAKVQLYIAPCGRPRCSPMPGGLAVGADICAKEFTMSGRTLRQMTGIELGEQMQKNPQRPSLILKRVQDASLWDLAKQCGTTASAIREANQLTQEPTPGQLLIIPVP